MYSLLVSSFSLLLPLWSSVLFCSFFGVLTTSVSEQKSPLQLVSLWGCLSRNETSLCAGVGRRKGKTASRQLEEELDIQSNVRRVGVTTWRQCTMEKQAERYIAGWQNMPKLWRRDKRTTPNQAQTDHSWRRRRRAVCIRTRSVLQRPPDKTN